MIDIAKLFVNMIFVILS